MGTISAVLVSLSAIIYLYSIYRGETKPQIGTWFIWTTLSTATALSMHEAEAVSYMIMTAAILDAVILITAIFYRGVWTWDRLDIWCLALAGVGIVLRFIFGDPLLVIAFALAATVLGSVPTMKKALHEPKSEPASAYVVAMSSCIIQIMAIPSWGIVHWLQPLVWFLNGGIIFCLIVMNPMARAALQYRWYRLSRIGVGE